MPALLTSRMTLADALLKEGVINREQHDRALREYDRTKNSLARILTEMGAINESTRMDILRRSTDCDILNLEDTVPSAEVSTVLTREQCRRMHAVPLRFDEESVLVAMEDPTDMRSLADIEKMFGRPVKACLAASKQIAETIERMPASVASQDAIALPHGLGYRILAFLSLLFITFAPAAIFYYAVIFTNGGRKWHDHIISSVFEDTLFFFVIWGSWASIAYFLNDLIFGEKKV